MLTNFRRIVVLAVAALTITVGSHQVAFLYGMSPFVATTIAAVAIATATVPVAVAIVVAVDIFAAVSFGFIAGTAAVIAFVAVIVSAIAITIADIAVVAIAVVTSAIVVADKYRLKFRWVVLVFGIEGVAICAALTISGSAGPGAVVGFVGVAVLGGLWLLAPRLRLATQK